MFQPQARQKQLKLTLWIVCWTQNVALQFTQFFNFILSRITLWSSPLIVLSLLSLLFFPLSNLSQTSHIHFFCSRLEIQKPLGIIDVCQQIIRVKKDYPFPTQIPVLNSNHTSDLLLSSSLFVVMMLLQNPEIVEDTLKLLWISR